jgi:hypothetical protein
MRYVARVTQVLQSGIHKLATVENGEVGASSDLPLPNRIEIELDGSESEPCMMYRYAHNDTFCGDTWHETFASALEQARFEYGLERDDLQPVQTP